VVYDPDAHAGYFSLMASVLTGSTGRVISFKPLPGNIALLRRHPEINRIQNCTIVEAALSVFDGRFEGSGGHDRQEGRVRRDFSTSGYSVRHGRRGPRGVTRR
jgi:FkbM family methyltransferase